MAKIRLLKIQSALLTALTLASGLTALAGAGAEPPAGNTSTTPTKQSSTVASAPLEGPLVRADAKIVINIPSRTLWVYNGDKIVRYFPVGVGRPGFMTPTGEFSVIRKVLDPGWENPYQANGKSRIAPGAANPLGTRWIGFHQKNGGEFGIHGTDNPRSVGKFSSHGCVRMKVPDAEAVFDLVDVGTPVQVVYEPVLIRQQGENVRVIVFGDPFKKGVPSAEKVKADILKQYPNAEIDTAKLAEALKLPAERPIDVARLVPKTAPTQAAAKSAVTEDSNTASSKLPQSALPAEIKLIESGDTSKSF